MVIRLLIANASEQSASLANGENPNKSRPPDGLPTSPATEVRRRARRGLVVLVTYQIGSRTGEDVSLASTRPGCGIGTAPLAQIEVIARHEGCVRALLITNDNLDTLRFYQKRCSTLLSLDW
jgi:hypothetical protein